MAIEDGISPEMVHQAAVYDSIPYDARVVKSVRELPVGELLKPGARVTPRGNDRDGSVSGFASLLKIPWECAADIVELLEQGASWALFRYGVVISTINSATRVKFPHRDLSEMPSQIEMRTWLRARPALLEFSKMGDRWFESWDGEHLVNRPQAGRSVSIDEGVSLNSITTLVRFNIDLPVGK